MKLTIPSFLKNFWNSLYVQFLFLYQSPRNVIQTTTSSSSQSEGSSNLSSPLQLSACQKDSDRISPGHQWLSHCFYWLSSLAVQSKSNEEDYLSGSNDSDVDLLGKKTS